MVSLTQEKVNVTCFLFAQIYIYKFNNKNISMTKSFDTTD